MKSIRFSPGDIVQSRGGFIYKIKSIRETYSDYGLLYLIEQIAFVNNDKIELLYGEPHEVTIRGWDELCNLVSEVTLSKREKIMVFS